MAIASIQSQLEGVRLDPQSRDAPKLPVQFVLGDQQWVGAYLHP